MRSATGVLHCELIATDRTVMMRRSGGKFTTEAAISRGLEINRHAGQREELNLGLRGAECPRNLSPRATKTSHSGTETPVLVDSSRFLRGGGCVAVVDTLLSREVLDALSL